MPDQARYQLVKKRYHHKNTSKKGDLIVLISPSYTMNTILVESPSDREVFEELTVGSLAILIEKRKDSATVMTSSGFLGWVYNDEWIPENI